MAPKGEAPVKKPSKLLQRRLFSFDSIKSSSTAHHHSDSESSSTSDRVRSGLTPKVSTLHLVDGNVPPSTNWTDQPLIESPQSEEHGFSLPESTNSASETQPSHKTAAIRSNTSDSVPVSSRSRWEHLRQHVLPSSTESVTPSVRAGHSQQFSSISAPHRSSTPKPSRLARLGFRQVVDHAREVAIDSPRKFADDIKRACWVSHYGEYSKGSKADANTLGSSLHLPFSLPTSTNSSTIMLSHTTQKKNELRRPPSIQSPAQSYRATPSLKYLHQTLLHYASPARHRPDTQLYLPYESQVLSTLLGPFLSPETDLRVDEDRWLAIECFEIAVKTWTAQAEELTVERCIWCCKAATIPPSAQRTRVLAALWSVLLHPSCQATTPITLQTLVQALLSLLRCLASQPVTDIQAKESKLVGELILQVRSGSCGKLNVLSVEEAYGATFLVQDDDQTVREALVSESLTRCLENGTEVSRRWILNNLMEEYWPLPPQSASFTPLIASIHSRKIDTFGRASVALLLSKPTNPETARLFTESISRIVQIRVLPELQAIEGHADARCHIVRIMLEFLCMTGVSELTRWANSLLCHWYRELPEWKLCIEKTLGRLISDSGWPTVLRVLPPVMKTLPEDVRKPIVAFTLPLLSDQLRDDPPPHPCLPLTELLDSVSRMYPKIFYKPLFACAASSKEPVVLNVLSLIAALSKFLPDFWTRDAEMISVALMSDVSGGEKGAAEEIDKPAWGNARLGQSVLLLELITQIQAIRDRKEPSLTDQEVKFFSALESRLGILLDAKELKLLVPPSQRLLFCLLFLHIRLLTRSLKSSTWLSRLISWLLQDAEIANDSDVLNEEAASVNQLQTLYLAAHEVSRPSRKSRNTMLLSPTLSNTNGKDAHRPTIVDKKAQVVASISCGFRAKALELLVALSGMLTSDDYRQVAVLLWSKCLDCTDPQVFAPASFLTMQCAEKIQADFMAIIEADMQSSDSAITIKVIRRISALFNWRFQILSQYVIVDRAHRRPFKLPKGPLPFVATDIGSSLFVLEEDASDLKDKFPMELRKRLSEIGWAQEDKPVDQKLEWINTPMSLLPAYHLDRMDGTLELPLSPLSPDMSPVPSPTNGATLGDVNESRLLLRRKSSAGGSHAVKRRSTFVPALAVIFLRLASFVFDSNFAVASAARSTVMDLMRNDPTLLTRPVFDLLAEDQKDMSVAISTLRAFLHVRHSLPPAMAHLVFNNLAGFLKYAARQDETPDALPDFAHIVPIVSRLVTHVSDMSIREIRRAKVEPFFIPSGSLWFPSSAPTGSMFPRMLGYERNPLEAVPPTLVAITSIRLSQNMFFLAMLKRHPQDVHVIRKNMSRLVLPTRQSRPEPPHLDVKDFVPHKLDLNRNDYVAPNSDVALRGLSLMLSRSYLLLVAQVFRSMSRHLNDRNELALLIDGLNRILLVHGDDIGIVGQAMIALMVASTRFRRLFTSGGGYTLFMPAIFKIYAEAESHSGIRLAIDYTVNRFYALHQTHFVFQSLDILGHVMMVSDVQTDWIAQNVFTLFASLGKGIPPNTPDAAGIHNSNKVQEREALIVTTAEEKPQTFLASLRQGNQGQNQVAIALPEEYEAGDLGLDNFVRLFLTVIAHDPTILRAEQFLRFFRFLVPHFYKSSGSTRYVLREGIDALGIVLLRAAVSKGKTSDVPLTRPKGNSSVKSRSSEAFLESHDRSKTPSDLFSMRLDYLSLIVAFIRSGGQVGTATSQRTIELIKLVLRDSDHGHSERISCFFVDYARASLIRDTPPSIKEVATFLSDLAPVISAYAIAVDFSGVFNTISQLATNPLYANEPVFSRIVVTQICAAGLSSCELAASESVLLTLSLRPSLVSLVAQAVFLRGADVIAEVEKRTPSYHFLAGVVLPLVMTLKTSAEIVSDGLRTEAWHRDVHARAWVRLLSYAMSACRKRVESRESSHLHLPGGIKYRDKRISVSSADNAQMTTSVTAVQIVKAIIIRAETDLSASLPGIWSRVASFFKSLLDDGNAKFALTSREHSAAPSPIQSPRTSTMYPDQAFPSFISTGFLIPSNTQSLCSPRIIDYTLWSLMELLCLYRSPLLIQMRLFMQEKVAVLDQDLRPQQTNFGPASPRSRVSSSIFSKPRGRMSPDNSPRLSPSRLSPHELTLSIPDVSGRQPGYQYFPSPSGKSPETRGPKIVHLGPVHNISSPTLPNSPSLGGVRVLAQSTTVKSLSLVRRTYRRIRVVQTWMGYDAALLPFPGEQHTEDPENMTTWTRKQAMVEVIRETKELMEEFVTAAEEDMVMVDADQPMTF